MFIEPNRRRKATRLKCRTRDTMLAARAPLLRRRSPTRSSCSPSRVARSASKPRRLLDAKGYAPIEIPLENKVRGRVIGAVSGKGTAPQVFINGSLIGGLEELKAHFA